MKQYEIDYPYFTWEWESIVLEKEEEENPYAVLIENIKQEDKNSKLNFLNSLEQSELIALMNISKEIQDHIKEHPEKLV